MKAYNDGESFGGTLCVMLGLSEESSKALANTYPLGDTSLHCTLMYFGDLPENPVITDKAVDVIMEEMDLVNGNIEAKTIGVDQFEDAVVLLLENEELHKVNNAIKAALKKAGIEFELKYPEYKPHVTIGSLEPEEKLPLHKPVDLVFDTVILSIDSMEYVAPLEDDLPDVNESKVIDTDPDPSPNPGARKLRLYWTRGKGAAKIRWGTKGDWRRCVKHLTKYVGVGAPGLCQVYHKEAMGFYTGDTRNKSLPDIASVLTKANYLVNLDMTTPAPIDVKTQKEN